jgi:hypothetical protein
MSPSITLSCCRPVELCGRAGVECGVSWSVPVAGQLVPSAPSKHFVGSFECDVVQPSVPLSPRERRFADSWRSRSTAVPPASGSCHETNQVYCNTDAGEEDETNRQRHVLLQIIAECRDTRSACLLLFTSYILFLALHAPCFTTCTMCLRSCRAAGVVH